MFDRSKIERPSSNLFKLLILTEKDESKIVTLMELIGVDRFNSWLETNYNDSFVENEGLSAIKSNSISNMTTTNDDVMANVLEWEVAHDNSVFRCRNKFIFTSDLWKIRWIRANDFSLLVGERKLSRTSQWMRSGLMWLLISHRTIWCPSNHEDGDIPATRYLFSYMKKEEAS